MPHNVVFIAQGKEKNYKHSKITNFSREQEGEGERDMWRVEINVMRSTMIEFLSLPLSLSLSLVCARRTEKRATVVRMMHAESVLG
jgi:DNA-directed RNA polymerase beta' subunit